MDKIGELGFEAEPRTQDAHPSVFHYTSSEGVFGILSSGCIRATHYKSLNDNSELQTIRPVLENALAKSIAALIEGGKVQFGEPGDAAPSEYDIHEEARHIVGILYEALFEEGKALGQPFVVSFCGTPTDAYVRDNGLLNMWQAYGADGGYAIQFNTERLLDCAKSWLSKFQSYALFSSVCYGPTSEDWAYLSARIEEVAEIAPLYIVKRMSGSSTGYVEEERALLDHLIQLAVRLKHRAFVVEDEVRLCVLRGDVLINPLAILPIDHILQGKVIVPYLTLFGGSDVLTTIERIIVGPHKDCDQRANALRIYLRNREIDAKVIVSEIPYRAR